MGFFANIPSDEYRVASMGSLAPVTELTPDSIWSGTGEAIYKSATGGLASVGRTLGDAFMAGGKAQMLESMAYSPNTTDQQVAQYAAAPTPTMPGDKQLQAVQDWAKLDPRVHGTGAQVVGSTAHGVTVFGLGSLAGGPYAGAGLLATTEGYNDYRESIAAGIDQKTAMEKAGLTGTMAGLGAFLPMKFGGTGASGLFKSMAGGASINTGFGVANRWLTSELLEHAGYKDMAAQYRPLDAQSLAADAVLGVAFGGFAHFTHGANVPPAERPALPEIEQALESRRQEMIGRGAAGIPADPVAANIDAMLQDRALGDVLRGRTPEVEPELAQTLAERSVIDPERVQLNEDWLAANRAVHGDMANFDEPPLLREAVEPYPVLDQAVAPPAAGEAEGAAKLGPIAQEQLRQLAMRHPDLDVTLPDGRVVKAADMPDALAEQMSAANKDAKLHEVAAACFLRTIG